MKYLIKCRHYQKNILIFDHFDFFSAILKYPTKTTTKNDRKISITHFIIISSYRESLLDAVFQGDFDAIIAISLFRWDS